VNRAARILALETEAQRLKDRLDILNRQIEGDVDAWWQITTNMPGDVATVEVRPVLAEARQYALALATVAKTLDALSDAEQEPAKPAADAADEVKKRREQKLAEARKRKASEAL
jgi:hypothetical protein